MFLDNVVHDRAEISEPWRAFVRAGNSLFFWSIGYGIVCLIVFGLLAVVGVFSVLIPWIKAEAFVPAVIPGLVTVITLFLVFGIVAGYVSRFLEDFVVPIMYKHGLMTTQAWKRFFVLLGPYFWTFVGYGLFYLLLSLLAGILVVLIVLATCCVAGCLMAIPYLGAVVALPLTVFFRLYSLEYLRQFGKEYDVFPAPEAPETGDLRLET
jgi:hypothetical protein